MDQVEHAFISRNVGAVIKRRFEYKSVGVLIFWAGPNKGRGKIYGYVLFNSEHGPLEAWGNNSEAEAEEEALADIEKVANGLWRALWDN